MKWMQYILLKEGTALRTLDIRRIQFDTARISVKWTPKKSWVPPKSKKS
jgi:hypothetical protein